MPLSKSDSQKQIRVLKTLALQGQTECWPIPPESGLALALAKARASRNVEIVFERKWKGNYKDKGERDKFHMNLCYGKECEASVFLDNENFREAFIKLYGPIFQLTG